MTPLDYAAMICYSSREVLQFTYDKAKEYSNKDGCYVECGVAAGAQIIAMAYGAPNKTIYAFDSFQGIPLPSNRDDQMPGIRKITIEEQKLLPDPGKQKLESTGATCVSEGDFWHNIDTAFGPKKHSNIITKRGWFEDTVKVFDSPISILRLDGDLYNSTYVCLQNLFPFVEKGGIIIIDDWALPGCREAVQDYLISTNQFTDIDINFIISDESTLAYWIK